MTDGGARTKTLGACHKGDAMDKKNVNAKKIAELNAKAVELYEADKIPEAIAVWREAAELGDAAAMNNIGCMCEEGYAENKPKAMMEAFGWYKKAAELGDAEAQLNTANAYHHGQGVKPSMTEAVKWYEIGRAHV